MIVFYFCRGIIELQLHERSDLMFELEKVLHKPTPPPNGERWHIVLQGHPEELLDALAIIVNHDRGVIQTAEWLEDDELLICLKWIDEVMPRFAESDILKVSFDITIKHNGREPCRGHNL